MKFKSILIVTYGRSGSTLLQGVLNSIDGVTIRGENLNFIFYIFNSYRVLRNAIAKENLADKNYGTARHPFFGAAKLNEQLFIDSQKTMIKHLLLADNQDIGCYGFKEIRYFDSEYIEDLEEYLDFLQLIFEDVAIVFNTRNPRAVSQSAWWKDYDKNKLISRIRKADKRFVDYAKVNPNCIIVDYDKIVDKSDILRLFEFLSEPYDENNIDSVLNIEHSYNNKSINLLN